MADFEHGLFMLLLLVGVFNARLPNRGKSLPLLAAGVLLALLPPFVRIPIPWDIILFLTVPILFWQTARRWLRSRWRLSRLELGLWLLTAAALSAAVLIPGGYLNWVGAVLFGIVAASVLWRAVEPDDYLTHIGQVGSLTLVFLLTEIAPIVETPRNYLGGLFSGAVVGIGTAWLAMRFVQRISPGWKAWVPLLQAYIAFALSALIGASGVAAALISIAIYAELGLRRGEDERDAVLSAPLNYPWVFVIFLAVFILLGWQAHQPLTWVLVVESVLGLVIGLLVAWIGRQWELPGFQPEASVWRTGLRVGLFLFAALLLWPRQVLLDPLLLVFGLGVAVFMSALAVTLVAATTKLEET